MKKFECERCGKNFKYKHHLESHHNKKNKCDKLVNDNELLINDKTIKSCIYNVKEINAKSMREYLDLCLCIYCKKQFSYKHSVLYHIKNNCKIVKEIEDEKNKIFEGLKIIEEKEYEKIKKLEEENKKLKTDNKKIKDEMERKIKELQRDISKNSQKLTNNIYNIENSSIDNSINKNINNTQQNIYLVGYKQEDLERLDKNEILAIMKRGFQSPVELTKTIHFNPKYPEFHNIYIPRINERFGMVYLHGRWRIMDKNELVEDIYENKRDFIIQNMENFIAKLDEPRKRSLKRWLCKDNNDDESIKNTKNDIKMLLYNNRHMAMNRKKEIENLEKTKNLEVIKKIDLQKN